MLPNPLHPAVVHLPLGLAVMLPLFIFLVMIGIGKQWFNHATWVLVVILQLLCMVGGIVSIETGEDQEEIVGTVVKEEFISKHEDMAKAFTASAGVTFGVALVGFFLRNRQRAFSMLSLATFFLSLVTLGVAGLTGHTGGELVYKQGAASAYHASP